MEDRDNLFENAVDGIAALDVYGAIILQGFARPRPPIVEDEIVIVDTPDDFK